MAPSDPRLVVVPRPSETNYLCVAAIAIQLECLDYQFLPTIVDYALCAARQSGRLQLPRRVANVITMAKERGLWVTCLVVIGA